EAFLQGFRAALAAAGLTEGQNVQLEVRSAEGSDTLLPQKATELVRLKADVIVASLTPAVQAARHATSDIPIVMAAARDAVATGLISSLARPGGNITGVSGAAVETAGKSQPFSRADRGTQPAGNRGGVCRVCSGARSGGHGGRRRCFLRAASANCRTRARKSTGDDFCAARIRGGRAG